MPPTLHVLIVDDHPEVRVVLANVVAQLYPAAAIAEAVDGAEALSAITQHRPDLIMTDYQMPGMNGLELVRTLRAQGAAMPILALSSETSIAAAIRAAGATAFLAKPFRVRELRETLRALLPTSAEMQTAGE